MEDSIIAVIIGYCSNYGYISSNHSIMWLKLKYVAGWYFDENNDLRHPMCLYVSLCIKNLHLTLEMSEILMSLENKKILI